MIDEIKKQSINIGTTIIGSIMIVFGVASNFENGVFLIFSKITNIFINKVQIQQ